MLAGKRTATAYVPRTGAAGPWLSPFQMPLLRGGQRRTSHFSFSVGFIAIPCTWRGGYPPHLERIQSPQLGLSRQEVPITPDAPSFPSAPAPRLACK